MSGIVLLVAAPGVASAAAPGVASGALGVASGAPGVAPAAQPGPCQPRVPAQAPATDQFFDNQPFLGPKSLPAVSPVGSLLRGYQRFGPLNEQQFVTLYRTGSGWVWPPDDGFVVRGGRPVKSRMLLAPRSRIDRFGFPGGAFLSPAGTSFAQRALPPESLDTPVNAPLSNYHAYCVLTAFNVDAGPAAPWFAQAGLGTQYKLELKYLPQAGTRVTVTWLLEHGYLVEEVPSTTRTPVILPVTGEHGGAPIAAAIGAGAVLIGVMLIVVVGTRAFASPVSGPGCC